VLHASGAGVDPSDRECLVVPFDPYDATALGLARLDQAVGSRATPGDAMTLDLTQAVPIANTAQTVGDALNAGRAQGFGKWVQAGNILTLFAPDGITPVRTFTLDSATDPTQRV